MLSCSRSLLSQTIKRKTKTRLKTNKNVSRKQKFIAKNQQLEDNEEEKGFDLKSSAPSHSHGVQPLGNLYLNLGSINSRNTGLGNLQILSDELIFEILGLLEGTQLGVLATVSKSFYVFTSHEPLWRNLVLDNLKGGFLYNRSWKSWLCANLEMKPEWLERDNIIRKRWISVDDFVMNFEEPNKPLLLEGCMDNWDALGKWDRDYLVNLCGDVQFSVGPVKIRLEDYFSYSDQVKEERPLYLFDPKFAEKIPTLGSEYEVPVYFREDLFSVLGNERPDYRWIITGPAGSGLNPFILILIRHLLGMRQSPDGAEVACPVSIIKWFMNFYGATKNWKKRPIECICKAGEVIFVPNGWWHLVINLEESIAITQNYVSRRNLLNVLDFLRKPNASELVLGTRDGINLYEKFKNAIEASFPGTIDELTLKAEEKKAQQKKMSFWDSVTDSKVGAVKFSF
ncbi:hypothetical protein CRYUN_Cryun08bG0112600 [Craigia yunnanensis]